MSVHQRQVLSVINGVVDTFGGSLRAAVNLAEAHAEGGAAVTLTAPVTRGEPHQTVDLMDPRVERRLFVATGPVARFGGSMRQFLWMCRNVRRFDEVDVHGVFSLSYVYVIVLAWLCGVPVLMWLHGSLDPGDVAANHGGLKRTIGPVVVRPLLNACAALMFTTEEESSLAQTYGARTPHRVVPLPIPQLSADGTDTTAWRRRHGVPAEVPLVLYLGRIVQRKKLPLLIEAMEFLERRDAHLVVVGQGGGSDDDNEAEARETADLRGLGQRVHFTGWLEGQDRIEAFFAADVFVLLSESENFGLSVVEAMSAGCPVVISDKLGLAGDLLSAEAAVAVAQADPAAVARVLDALIADPEATRQLGVRGREYVAREYSGDAIAARLCEVATRP